MAIKKTLQGIFCITLELNTVIIFTHSEIDNFLYF